MVAKRQLWLIHAFMLVLFASCRKPTGTAENLFRFPKDKTVFVQVNVNYRLGSDTGPQVDLQQQRFELSAFLQTDEDEIQVPIGLPGSVAVNNMPIALSSLNQTFDAFVQMPREQKPGPNGYAFRFELTPSAGSLRFLAAEESRLVTLRQGVQPAGTPRDYPVELSLVTTLTYEIVKKVRGIAGVDAQLQAFSGVKEMLTERMKSVEAMARSDRQINLATFTSAMKSGLMNEIVSDQELQSRLINALTVLATPSNNGQPTGESSSDSLEQSLARNFTSIVQEFGTIVAQTIGTETTGEAQVFNPETIRQASQAASVSYSNLVFKPKSATFEDVDITAAIKGDITVEAPAVKVGLRLFRVYLGGDLIELAKGQLLGDIDATLDVLTLSLKASITLQGNFTKIWIYPVAGDKELPAPLAIPLVNRRSFVVSATGAGTTVIPASNQSVSAGQTAVFTVTANGGQALSSSVGGTCPAGSWSGAVYTTGAITGDCSLQFSTSANTAQVSSSGTQVTINPSGIQTAPLGGTQSFTVAANSGYTMSNAVGGTCASGSWNGSIYTTGSLTADCSVSFSAVSNNANLSNLTLSQGSLSPAFASGTTAYTATVSYLTSALTITPTRADSGASITVDGSAVSSGSASGSINLTIGSNAMSVVVTSASGTTRTYTLTVTRQVAPSTLIGLTLSAGTLSPAFAAGTTSYTASVAFATSSLTVTAASGSGQNVTVNAISVATGTASPAINLNVGSNTITIVSNNGGGSLTTYTVAVTRRSNVSSLSALSFSGGSLSPSFSSATTSYVASVMYPVGSHTVTPTASDANATITVQAQSVNSGSPSQSLAFQLGTNTITIVVTAEDSSYSTTYTLAVAQTAPIRTTALGSSSITLSWPAAKASSGVTYEVYISSAANPSYGSFDTVTAVENGTLGVTLTDQTSTTINTGLVAGSWYYFNVVVSDGSGSKGVYRAHGQYFSSSDLIFWPFNANANDAVSSNNGSLYNIPSLTTDRFNFSNAAYAFTRGTTVANPPYVWSTNSVGISGNSSRTLSYWIKLDSINIVVATVAATYGHDNLSAATFGIYWTGSNAATKIWTGTGDPGLNETGSTSWVHWVVTYDSGTAAIRVFKNGTEASYAAGSAHVITLATADSQLSINRNPNSTANYSGNFSIDEVRMFNSALSGADVAKLYNSSR